MRIQAEINQNCVKTTQQQQQTQTKYFMSTLINKRRGEREAACRANARVRFELMKQEAKIKNKKKKMQKMMTNVIYKFSN